MVKKAGPLGRQDVNLEEVVDNWKRALADYQNLAKRTAEERKEWIRLANKELILRLLPVLDMLMIAADHVPNEGLKLSVKEFSAVLKNEGVEKIETVGQEFDPKLMECVETGEGEKNRVLREVRVGYLLNGQVLRPAQVRVGKRLVD